MLDQLLNLYNIELKALQHEAQLFATKHLDQSSTLGTNLESIKEPLVKHLTQSFAFLCARARLEFIEAQSSLNKLLLKTIAPQLEDPLPSFSIVQFKLRKNEQNTVQISKNRKIITLVSAAAIKPSNATP